MKKSILLSLFTFFTIISLNAQNAYDRLITGNRLPAAGQSATGVATGDRYRFIDDAAAVPLQESETVTRSYLYALSSPVSVTENGQPMYLGTDIRGSVRTVTDRYGNVTARADYDAFGAPVTPDAVMQTGLGYAGKPFDFTTGLYDYGFRDYSPATGRFTTTDPIRYGRNWYAYVSNDPVNYVDLWGLVNIKPIELLMQDERWGKKVLGSSTKENAALVEQSGCYLTSFSAIATSLTGQLYTPLSFNDDTSLFDAEQNFDSTTVSGNIGLIADYWTQSVQGDLTKKLNELNKSETEYGVMAQIPYDDNGHLHWVMVYGGVDDDGWIDIVGPSVNDSVKASRRLTDTWNFTESGVQIKASEIRQLRTFTVDPSFVESVKTD